MAVNIAGLQSQIDALKADVEDLKKEALENKVSIALLRGELDKVVSAFVIASGAVAMGMEVVMYFTFWSIPALLDKNKVPEDAGEFLGAGLPKGADDMELARLAPGGIDTAALKTVMARSNMPSLAEMISLAEELGVRIYVSDKSTDLLGFDRDAFIDYEGMSFAGVATFLAEARKSRIQLFI